MKYLRNYSAALILAIFLSACASTAEHQGPGEYIEDTMITTKVKAAFLNDPVTKVLEINVETYGGEVQLSGFVSSQEAIDRAVELTRNVEGVTSVKNDMLLRQP